MCVWLPRTGLSLSLIARVRVCACSHVCVCEHVIACWPACMCVYHRWARCPFATRGGVRPWAPSTTHLHTQSRPWMRTSSLSRSSHPRSNAHNIHTRTHLGIPPHSWEGICTHSHTQKHTHTNPSRTRPRTHARTHTHHNTRARIAWEPCSLNTHALTRTRTHISLRFCVHRVSGYGMRCSPLKWWECSRLVFWIVFCSESHRQGCGATHSLTRTQTHTHARAQTQK